VVDVRQGDGTYVTTLDPSLLLDAMAFVVDFYRDDTILQFFEVRRILEPAAGMAASTMGDEDVARLREVLDRLGPAPTVEELVADDTEFHRRIAAGSRNVVPCSLIEGLSGPT
jgi:GntR family transcriptional repressor for pyruvate dehydrogenase complex